MADNTLLNVGTGGDTVRDLARQAGLVKTQVVQLDLGGATANAEVLITAGQQLMAASVPVVLASNQSAILTRPYAPPASDWSFAAIAGGIIDALDVVIAPAQVGLKNYITGIAIQNANTLTSTEVILRDGATVIFRGYVGGNTPATNVIGLVFATPLKTSVNTALIFACVSTSTQVYFNAQGYTAI